MRDKFAGALLGLALGDAFAAPYEGGPLERLVWRLIGTTAEGKARFTDDTQMSIDLAESLIAFDGLDLDGTATRFAASYRWSRGYGPAAAKLLKRIARGRDWRSANTSVYPNGSFGNGGAMRAPVIGLFFHANQKALFRSARESASITHAHELGQEGAVMLAVATASVLRHEPPTDIIAIVTKVTKSDAFKQRLSEAETLRRNKPEAVAKLVAKRLGNGISALDSCVTALYIAERFQDSPFEDLLAFAIACGGDTDTIAAMSGAIWGAANGQQALPVERLTRLEQKDRIRALAVELHDCQLRQ